MRTISAFLLACSALALAHFQLQHPPPRGPFVAKNEPTYCDGYATTTDNRTQFPLSGGFYSLHSGHPSWTFGVQIANTPNPTSFDNYTTVVPFFPNAAPGDYCFPIDLQKAGVANLTEGANVTLQFTFDGGDGNLYQCADVTLVSNVTDNSPFTCQNVTASTNTSSSSIAAPSPTGSTSGAPGLGANIMIAGVAWVAAVAFTYYEIIQ